MFTQYRGMDTINQLPFKQKKEAIDYLAHACKSILENKVKLAYAKNYNIQGGRNFVSLETMLDAVTVIPSYKSSNILSVFIDENKLFGSQEFRKNLYDKPETAKGFSFSYQEAVVGGAEKKWASMVNKGQQQNLWVLREAQRDIEKFMKKDFTFWLSNKFFPKKGGPKR